MNLTNTKEIKEKSVSVLNRNIAWNRMEYQTQNKGIQILGKRQRFGKNLFSQNQF